MHDACLQPSSSWQEMYARVVSGLLSGTSQDCWRPLHIGEPDRNVCYLPQEHEVIWKAIAMRQVHDSRIGYALVWRRRVSRLGMLCREPPTHADDGHFRRHHLHRPQPRLPVQKTSEQARGRGLRGRVSGGEGGSLFSPPVGTVIAGTKR